MTGQDTQPNFARDESGVAAIEVALMLPFFITLVFGAVDASNLLIQTHRVEQGLALGGAYLSKASDPVNATSRARNLAVNGQLSGGQARVNGWNAGDVQISFKSVGGNFRNGEAGRVAVLSTSHSYQGFGLIKSIMGGRVNVSATHEERIDT